MSSNTELTDKLEEFIPKLLRIARNRISPAMLSKFDEHDAVLSLVASLIRREQQGRFKFADNEELWKLVVVALKRKISNKVRAEGTEKRGGGKIASLDQSEFAEAISMAPDHADAVCFAELMEQIEQEIDGETKQILEYKLAGMNNREIAAKLDVVDRTVSRKLVVLRSIIDGIIRQDDEVEAEDESDRRG